jgi:hypothetical protein
VAEGGEEAVEEEVVGGAVEGAEEVVAGAAARPALQ